jgi:predicted lipoprotein with Yx(FWY)xxD motif
MGAHGRLASVVAVMAAAVMLFSACGRKSNAAEGGGSAALLGSGTAGSVGTVLTDSSGRTLYHLTSEKGGHIQCTGGCPSIWPPMLAVSGSVSTTVAGLPGRVGTIDRPDGGKQLTYDGMPLYRFSGDSGPGQANGQGIHESPRGVWYAVTPSGTVSGGTPSPTSSGRGYGGY